MRKYRNVPNKNVTVIISVLIIFLTSLLTYIITNVEFSFIPNNYKGLIVIILGIINTFLGCFPLIYFFTLGGQNWIIKQFMVILFNAFFSDRLMMMKQKYNSEVDQCTYRITYYKFYRNKSVGLRLHFLLRRLFRKKYGEQRQVDTNHDYLLCAYRYGVENGRYDTQKTTKPYILYDNDEMLKGVASLIYRGNSKLYLCIDNININVIVQKIIKNNKTLSLYDKKYSRLPLETNIEGMKELLLSYNQLCSDHTAIIQQDEINELIEFMKNTHTDYNDIFDISGGMHSNHFLGFKVYNKRHEAIGVFIIDAKEPIRSSFEDIVFNKAYNPNVNVKKSDTKWIKQVLETFSNLTSESIFDLNSEKEKKHGKRIRD